MTAQCELIESWDVSTAYTDAQAPVSLDEARDHCIIEDHDQDASLARKLKSSIAHAERVLGRNLGPVTVLHKLSNWPQNGFIYAPTAPIRAITSVKYLDTNGVEQTITSTNYALIQQVTPIVRPISTYSWPSLYEASDAVRIEWAAGWATAAAVPMDIKEGVLKLLSEFNWNREDTIAGMGTSAPNGPSSLDLLGHHVFYRIPNE